MDPSSVLAGTHVLIWYATAPSMLSMTALRMMEQSVAAGQPIIIASVSLIELVYIAEKRSDSIDADTLRELLRLPLLTKDGILTRHFPKLCVW